MADEVKVEAGEPVSEKVSKIVEAIGQLNLVEAAELVKAMEKKFGVSAAPVATVAAAPGAAAASPAAEEKTTVDVILKTAGDQKLQVIKVVRQFTNLGLKEAKALVEAAPKSVKEGATKEEGQKIKEELEKVGASVEVK